MADLVAQVRATQWSWVAVAVILAPVGLWTRARRWQYLFPARSEPPALFTATAIGYMANNVLPLRAGELARVYVVARRWGHGFWTVLATLVVERVLDSVAIVLILGVLVLLIPVPPILEWTALVLLVIDAVAVAVLVAIGLAPERCHALVARLTGSWPRLERRLVGVVDTFGRGLEGVRTRAHLVPLLLWTTIVWVVPALAGWTMLHAMNLRLPWIAGWTVLAFTGLGVTIPSAPGYVGVFHAAAALAVTMFGIPQSTGIGYALLYHASQYVPVTLLGWLFLVREHVTLGEARRAQPLSPTPVP